MCPGSYPWAVSTVVLGSVGLVAAVGSDAGSEGRKGDLPEIGRRARELDANFPLAVSGFVDIDHATLLMLGGALVHQAKHLPLAYAARQSQQAAIRVHREHARGFAKRL